MQISPYVSNLSSNSNIYVSKENNFGLTKEQYLNLQDVFKLLEKHISKFNFLKNTFSDLQKDVNCTFKNCQVERDFILQKKKELLDDLNYIYQSQIGQILLQSSNKLLGNIGLSLHGLIEEIKYLNNECINYELEIKSNFLYVENLKKDLSNKCSELEILKIRNSAINFSQNNDIIKSNDLDLKNKELVDSKLISAISKAEDMNLEIEKLNEMIHEQSDQFEKIKIGYENENLNLNQIILELKINLALQEKQIIDLQDKVSKYKEKINNLKIKIEETKNLTKGFVLYINMLPVFGGSILGSILINGKILGTFIGGLFGMIYNAYYIDRFKIIIDVLNKFIK